MPNVTKPKKRHATAKLVIIHIFFRGFLSHFSSHLLHFYDVALSDFLHLHLYQRILLTSEAIWFLFTM